MKILIRTLKTISTTSLKIRISAKGAKENIIMIHAPAAERNKDAILKVLQETLPKAQQLKILEIASGTGQHVSYFSKNFPTVQWQPSEVDERCLQSIQTFIDTNQLKNVKKPVKLDVTSDELRSEFENQFDAIYCANMIHISPWKTTLGLFSIAEKFLKAGGILITYGPYAVNGVLTPESNVNFDAGLKQQNPEWGVRDTKDLITLGNSHNIHFIKAIDMPANNKILLFGKEP